MCRSMRQSKQVLVKAAQRQVEWPQPKQYMESPIQVCEVKPTEETKDICSRFL